jgi:ribose 5-phosphate isomerase B
MSRVVVGADEARPILEHIAARLRDGGCDVTVLPAAAWGPLAISLGERVARGEFDWGIVCCWTGTGVCMAANKVPGVRAALCVDAQTAEGARKWNDANVLALSLRLLSEPLADEIVDAFRAGSYGGTEGESLAKL